MVVLVKPEDQTADTLGVFGSIAALEDGDDICSVSLSPSFNSSPNDFLGPANALNVFGDPLKAPNPPNAGGFASTVVGVGEACEKGDLNAPKGEEEPNVGAVAA